MNQTPYRKIIGEGPPLVLLHGWGWNSSIWEPLIPALSAHFQLYLVDLPGCGQSPFPTDYRIETIANLLLSVAPPEAKWLGWSLGGMIAWWLAIHYPNRIKKLITVASSPRFIQDPNWPGVSQQTLNKFARSLQYNQEKTLLDFLALQLRGSTLNSQELASHLTRYPSTPTGLEGGLQLLQQLDLRPDLPHINCPSTHIYGSLDALVPPQIATIVQTAAPQSQCTLIKRSGHIPFLSHPSQFLATLFQP
jgi:pimeloyl-[acyl-carrier protein] methyl ester esterase